MFSLSEWLNVVVTDRIKISVLYELLMFTFRMLAVYKKAQK